MAGQKVDKYEMNTFSVPYQKGKLEAVGYKNGKEVSRTKVETSDEPFAVQLIPDRSFLNGDGQDAIPITVKVIDKKGREVPAAQNLIQFTIKGSGKIIGVGNGNPNSHELEKVNQRSLFNGLAQVIVQADEDTNAIELVASTEGLKPFSLKIPVRKATIMPFVKVINSVVELNEWHISAFSDNKPNPTQEVAENDMNSWLPTKSAQLQLFTEGKYALLRTNFSLNDGSKERKLVFKNLVGKAEFWLDNQLIFKKDNNESTTISVPFNGQNKSYKLVVLIETEKNQRAGLGGLVTIE